MRISVGAFIPAAPFQAIASRASRRSPAGSGPTHRQTLPLGGVCVNRTSMEQIFKENRFAKGEFVGLGRTLNLRNITCPANLLAGANDDITAPEQVLDAAKYIGTPKDRIVQKTVPGGHIGLFMGARTLNECWPSIARWICAQ